MRRDIQSSRERYEAGEGKARLTVVCELAFEAMQAELNRTTLDEQGAGFGVREEDRGKREIGACVSPGCLDAHLRTRALAYVIACVKLQVRFSIFCRTSAGRRYRVSLSLLGGRKLLLDTAYDGCSQC